MARGKKKQKKSIVIQTNPIQFLFERRQKLAGACSDWYFVVAAELCVSSNMDLDSFNKNNKQNALVKSIVPDITKAEPCILGVDEAGRGPVLGPMVYGIAYCPLSAKDQLKELGFADSKTLTEEKREELLSVIEKNSSFLGFMVELISPVVISELMLHV
ncbi:hypothetical protein V5799_005266 [Amblyomma americanum]|uniref:Ribonuclease n=1 Tax=Amblyomma americanum TaxID=6943 RepID=A0AAQ4DZR3_AMBAM